MSKIKGNYKINAQYWDVKINGTVITLIAKVENALFTAKDYENGAGQNMFFKKGSEMKQEMINGIMWTKYDLKDITRIEPFVITEEELPDEFRKK